jgi:protein O-GlcNAc transferase
VSFRATLKRAIAHHQRGELGVAADLYRSALREAPRDFQALHLLGAVEFQRSRYAEAVDLFSQAIQADPNRAIAHSNLGSALTKLTRFDEALGCYDRALAAEPDFVEAFYGRGNVLRALERHDEAVESYRRALQLNPNHAHASYNLGNALRDLDRPEEAIASYDRALALFPTYTDALVSRGNILHSLRSYKAAVESFDRAIAANPQSAEAFNSRGNALSALLRHAEALESYDSALALRPEYPEALSNRANLLRALKRYEEAAETYERLLASAPNYPFAAGELLRTQIAYCRWHDIDDQRRAVVDSVMHGEKVITPFSLVAISDSGAAQYECARNFTRARYPERRTGSSVGQRHSHERIRLAYLSGSFYNHAQGALIAGLLEAHDKARFEIFGVSWGVTAEDHMHQRLRRAFEHFIDAEHISDRAVANLLREREIDIAVDLKGLGESSRLGIFAHRPAPVQVAFLDYPGTTGADYIDYIIADPRVLPLEHEAFFSEKVVHLPHTYQVNDAKRYIAERTPTRADVGLPDEAFVFCCFNNNYKILPETFDIWMRLLRTVERSVLWLLEDSNEAARNLHREAAMREVAPERLVFAQRISLPEHLARHRLADLFLDTLPCNAHTTASDALWAGLPVLTRTGDAFASRVAASLLFAAGLPELVTGSNEEYEALALTLATTPSALADIKAKLERTRTTCPLFDTELFRGHIESAYTTMWERAKRGDTPEKFVVPPT